MTIRLLTLLLVTGTSLGLLSVAIRPFNPHPETYTIIYLGFALICAISFLLLSFVKSDIRSSFSSERWALLAPVVLLFVDLDDTSRILILIVDSAVIGSIPWRLIRQRR